jgi:hypothetical protein
LKNRGQGLLLSAVVAAGLLLRPTNSVATRYQEQSESAAGTKTENTQTEPGEGPWTASCKYWAPVRLPVLSAKTEVHNKLDATNGAIDLHVNLDETANKELGCDPSDSWGIPLASGTGIDLTAIIAIVPDPVHTHLALNFDRTVSAILQAASDNGYNPSYYWLPWRRSLGGPNASGSLTDQEPGHDPERERKPGLIILKHAPENASTSSLESFYKPVYLFLVAETPAEGVDGFQLQNAFRFEADLESKLQKNGNQFSRGRNGTAIIGPTFSGSAASLRAGIDFAYKDPALANSKPALEKFEVAGGIATSGAMDQLTKPSKPPTILAQSFENPTAFAMATFRTFLEGSGYDLSRVALLVENGTAYGTLTGGSAKDGIRELQFPRDISLLRNAQALMDQADNSPATAPSPFLRFSLKDSSAQDSVPQFSRENTPVSQEAELMAIGRYLHRYRFQFIAIAGSNTLDQVFLAQFLHRACPEARLVFLAPDLLTVREIDDVPFIGSIIISSYPLIGLTEEGSSFTDSVSEALYNAASYTFWHNHLGTMPDQPKLQNYQNPLGPKDPLEPALWATVLGSDGYYPLATLSPCASDDKRILPVIKMDPKDTKDPCKVPVSPQQRKLASLAIDLSPLWKYISAGQKLGKLVIFPSRLWVYICSLISLLGLFHGLMLLGADYWSAFTRDLAIRDNDQPRRRSTYIHAGAAALFFMSVVVSFPELCLAPWTNINPFSTVASVVVLFVGLFALIVTFAKTSGTIGWARLSGAPSPKGTAFRQADGRIRENRFFFLNLLTWASLLVLSVVWFYLCTTGDAKLLSGVPANLNLVGLSFSYRCINPGSGVSPLVPVLLLLLSWYLWSVLQTWRLRFSANGRPRLPQWVTDELENILFVSDNALYGSRAPGSEYLYENITSLMITRALLRRWRFRIQRPATTEIKSQVVEAAQAQAAIAQAAGIGIRTRVSTSEPAKEGFSETGIAQAQSDKTKIAVEVGAAGSGSEEDDDSVRVDIIFLLIYAALLIWFVFFTPIRSVDHFLWTGAYRSSPYEFVVNLLLLPILLLCLGGWLRMIVIWAALKQGLLEQLENQPIRFAFSRLKVMGWMKMLQHGGLQEQWRDMARSLESMRQMMHQEDLQNSLTPADFNDLQSTNSRLLQEIRLFLTGSTPKGAVERKRDFVFVNALENAFAEFSNKLLSFVLIPYWTNVRVGLVASEETSELPLKARRSETNVERVSLPMALLAGPASEEPARVHIAEEFLAIRYISLIRAVLSHLRYLMMFVSVSFVLAIVAWNSYPFQPRQRVDWLFTTLLILLGSGIVWVFAQMHRNPILSRITDTKANELGWDFYLRIASYGALPIFAWLTYQFPDIGSLVSKFVQPGTPVVK